MSDLDPYNHVNNGSQCNYFDMGRSLFFEQAFHSEIDWLTFKYVLVHVELDFQNPIRFHDDIVCESEVTDVGNASFKMVQRLVDQKTGLVKTLCHCAVVYFDRETNKSERIPDEDRELLGEWKVRTPSGCHIGKTKQSPKTPRTPSGCHIGRKKINNKNSTPSGCHIGKK